MSAAPKGPLHVGRFERRIVFAISIAAFVPFVVALILGRIAMHELVRLGVNERVVQSLDLARGLGTGYQDALRERLELAADRIALDDELEELATSGEPAAVEARARSLVEAAAPHGVLGVRVFRPSGELAATWAPDIDVAVEPPLLSRPIGGGARIELYAAPPFDPTEVLVEAGATRDAVREVGEHADGLADVYLGIAAAILLFVIVTVMAVAILLSRRVTRRVTLLADATDRVGAGDLTVEVPEGERDEVGELTRAFNQMVLDLRTSRDRVEYLERVGAWQEMARRLAHEIKNPLTPIQLAVQQAHQAYKGDDPRFKKTLEDAREIVDEEVQTLRRLVSEFSEFARLPEPKLVPLDLAGLVRDAVRGLDPEALRVSPSGRPAPALSTELPPSAIAVRADAQILRRCLDNLVRNAVQAIDEKGGSSVVVAAAIRGDDAVLEIRDDGPGVPADARERVFQPYFTTKELGTGLGLAIVKKAILEHGGSIECVEAPEGGACFRVRLPLAPDAPMKAA